MIPRKNPKDMLMPTFKRSLPLLALAALISAALPVLAQDASRKELRRVDLSGAPGMEVILSVTELAPGDEIPEHIHHGIETGYVLEGGTFAAAGKPTLTLDTGSPIMNLRDVPHGGYKVAGTRTIKLLTVHIVDKGKPLYDAAKK
jgi:quercetin dioxygenase-like cupin family protein